MKKSTAKISERDLIEALKEGNVDLVIRYIKEGGDVNIPLNVFVREKDNKLPVDIERTMRPLDLAESPAIKKMIMRQGGIPQACYDRQRSIDEERQEAMKEVMAKAEARKKEAEIKAKIYASRL